MSVDVRKLRPGDLTINTNNKRGCMVVAVIVQDKQISITWWTLWSDVEDAGAMFTTKYGKSSLYTDWDYILDFVNYHGA
jgi:hypothetical protein